MWLLLLIKSNLLKNFFLFLEKKTLLNMRKYIPKSAFCQDKILS